MSHSSSTSSLYGYNPEMATNDVFGKEPIAVETLKSKSYYPGLTNNPIEDQEEAYSQDFQQNSSGKLTYVPKLGIYSLSKLLSISSQEESPDESDPPHTSRVFDEVESPSLKELMGRHSWDSFMEGDVPA